MVDMLNATELFILKWLLLCYKFHLNPKNKNKTTSDNNGYIVFFHVPASETFTARRKWSAQPL